MNLALRIYRWLAQAFPHEFKWAYGPEVMRLGEDVVEEIAKRQEGLGLMRLIADMAIRVPLEYWSEMRGDMRHAWRALIKSPGFALVGIISMGLGIGLTTNVYSSRWAMIFRELPAAANAKNLSTLANMLIDALRVGTTDVRLLVGTPLLLAAVAMLACYVPARKAAQMDTLKALREK